MILINFKKLSSSNPYEKLLQNIGGGILPNHSDDIFKEYVINGSMEFFTKRN